MVAQYIATRLIMDLCELYVRRTIAWVYQRWWEQEILDLEGEKDREEAELGGEEEQHKVEASQEDIPGRE